MPAHKKRTEQCRSLRINQKTWPVYGQYDSEESPTASKAKTARQGSIKSWVLQPSLSCLNIRLRVSTTSLKPKVCKRKQVWPQAASQFRLSWSDFPFTDCVTCTSHPWDHSDLSAYGASSLHPVSVTRRKPGWRAKFETENLVYQWLTWPKVRHLHNKFDEAKLIRNLISLLVTPNGGRSGQRVKNNLESRINGRHEGQAGLDNRRAWLNFQILEHSTGRSAATTFGSLKALKQEQFIFWWQPNRFHFCCFDVCSHFCRKRS